MKAVACCTAQGVVPDSLQFVLDGKISRTESNGVTEALEPPAASAFNEILEGSPMKCDVQGT